ncbi:MAG: sigma-70 family RNA polymerase sigma factor [Armatimonadetes bacterium]|nr:sigma-70 family RNA polymerase sigma factor [Armatimonadota bacterium]
MEPSDDDLIASCLKGDRAAFNGLVARYQEAVYRLAYRMVGDREESKDIVQDTFVKAYRALGTFRRGASFSSWLLKIASNLCIDHLRQRRNRPLSLDASLEGGWEPLDERPSPEESAVQEERVRAVRKAVAGLPDKYRLPLLLRHSHDMSVEEIARMQGQPVGTVKSYLFRAREMVKRALREQGFLEDPLRSDRAEEP